MTAGMNLYYMDYIDQLVPTGELSTDGYPIMTNVKRSYRSGMEFSLGFIPASFLQWQVNLTWSRNKIKDFVESYVDYDSQTWIGTPEYRELGDVDIAYSPSMISSSDLAFLPLKELEIHLISQYVGEQYFVNTMNDDMKLDPWLVNNLRIDYTLSLKKAGQLGLHLQVNNLFNILYENNAYGATWWQDGQEYYWAAYFPQATRNFLFKMSWRF